MRKLILEVRDMPDDNISIKIFHFSYRIGKITALDWFWKNFNLTIFSDIRTICVNNGDFDEKSYK